jgi:hypothetical protein
MTSPEPARRMPPTALATCVLPWDDRLRFDEDAFREHVRLVAAHMTRGRFQAARGAGLRELGRLAEAVDELLEDSFRAACPSAHMDGAYEKVLARAHGARLALRLLPPYQGATEEAYRRFEAGLGLLPGLDSQ